MFNSMGSSVGALGRFGLTAIVLWVAPSWLFGQGAARPEQHSSNAGQPFAELDNALSRRADELLASPAQATFPATGKAVEDGAASTPPDPRRMQPSQLPGERGSSIAESRLNLLRPAVEPILRRESVPVGLAAVILVESGGRTTALSLKGARGLWQLMPDTARRYGLRVDGVQDDRLDLFKSTEAAARYLRHLYAQFGDWKLALAAYNTGEANVSSAIVRAHSDDFDQLALRRMLPLETRIYVPRVLAVAQSFGMTSSAGHQLATGQDETVQGGEVFAESSTLRQGQAHSLPAITGSSAVRLPTN